MPPRTVTRRLIKSLVLGHAFEGVDHRKEPNSGFFTVPPDGAGNEVADGLGTDRRRDHSFSNDTTRTGPQTGRSAVRGDGGEDSPGHSPRVWMGRGCPALAAHAFNLSRRNDIP
jgi:hypothetical protein